MEILPSETLPIIYGYRFSIISILILTVLEIIYVIAFKSWNGEIFATISALTGQIGIFISRKV